MIKPAERFLGLRDEIPTELWDRFDWPFIRRDTIFGPADAKPAKAKVVELPGVGHAPTLMHDDQVRIVREFLVS